MVLIIKKKNSDECFVVKMSQKGYVANDPESSRLTELVENISFDNLVIRKKIYQELIDKLINDKKWIRERNYTDTDVTNTLHDWIVECFLHRGIKKYFIEVEDHVFRG